MEKIPYWKSYSYRYVFIFPKTDKDLAQLIKVSLITRLKQFRLPKNMIKYNFNDLSGLKESDLLIGIVILNDETKYDETCIRLIDNLQRNGSFILPLIKNLEDCSKFLPESLTKINVFEMSNSSKIEELISILLENAGICESERKIFISYKRSDSSLIAEQLFEEFHKKRFHVFLDIYSIKQGINFEEDIFDSLDETSTILLIESPNSYKSKAIEKEVIYAIKNHYAIIVLELPNVINHIEVASKSPRFKLEDEDFFIKNNDNKFFLKNETILKLLEYVEYQHAYGIIRRLNNGILSLVENFKEKFERTYLLNNKTIYAKNKYSKRKNKIYYISLRPPKFDDFYHIAKNTKDYHIFKNRSLNIVYFNIPKRNFPKLKWLSMKTNIIIIAFNNIMEGKR